MNAFLIPAAQSSAPAAWPRGRRRARIRAEFEGRPLSKQDEASAPEALQDPRTKYPKPPFRRQEQPWPGLASKMDPRPDHGETSYRGSGRLAGRKALITGGDSGMGRAAAIAFARGRRCRNQSPAGGGGRRPRGDRAHQS